MDYSSPDTGASDRNPRTKKQQLKKNIQNNKTNETYRIVVDKLTKQRQQHNKTKTNSKLNHATERHPNQRLSATTQSSVVMLNSHPDLSFEVRR